MVPNQKHQKTYRQTTKSKPLIDKLCRAKSRTHRTGCPCWKYFGQRLKLQLRNFQQSQCDKIINKTTTGICTRWNNIKNVTGETKTNHSGSFINIHDTWYDIPQFCTMPNEYHVNIGGMLNLTCLIYHQEEIRQ